MKNLLIISLSLVFLISCEVEQSKNIYSPPNIRTKPIENFFYYSDLNSLEIKKNEIIRTLLIGDDNLKIINSSEISSFIDCGYMNEDYGHHFVNAGRSAHANAFHGPPKVDGPTLRTLVARYRDSPHELAAHLKKIAESENEVFRWNHQNAWSRKELSLLLYQNGFSEIELSSVNSASLRKRIPDFQVMEDWSMYMVASLLET